MMRWPDHAGVKSACASGRSWNAKTRAALAAMRLRFSKIVMWLAFLSPSIPRCPRALRAAALLDPCTVGARIYDPHGARLVDGDGQITERTALDDVTERAEDPVEPEVAELEHAPRAGLRGRRP